MTVVVPVYNGFDALNRCLTALQRHTDDTPVLLIDDASTDPRVPRLLMDYARRNQWQLRRHECNMGFVQTANEGMEQAESHVILLNADAIVTPHWLEAFARAIAQVPDLATATPWSNNAEICSFPGFLEARPVPDCIDELACALYADHTPHYPEIPTGVGFCLLVTRQAMDTIGYFDEAVFGHGYGEENDYCLRARAAGLRNIVLDNAYVGHIGNQSFAELGLKPDAASMQRLLSKHPDYQRLIGEYIDADPLAPLRCEIMRTLRTRQPQLAARLQVT